MGSIPTGPTSISIPVGITMNLRIVFMGSPNFAVPTLTALARFYQVVGVVTQPDKPAGRGRAITPPPVKSLSNTLNLHVIQPRRLSEQSAMAQIISWQPDVIIVTAFGQILRPEVLNLPSHGCINIHASLLPRWRGAAPIQAAIMHGDLETGISIMQMDPGVDTGPVLSQRSIPILANDTTSSLGESLSRIGAELLLDTLPDYVNGKIQPVSQDGSQATYAPMFKKEDGYLDFFLPAADLARRVRALNPWPGAYFYWREQIIKVHQARSLPSEEIPTIQSSPGRTITYDHLPLIGTSRDWLVLEQIQPAGKKTIPGKAFLAGAKDWGSTIYGKPIG